MVELAPPRRGEVNNNRHMWKVYILKSRKDDGYYVGCSSNIDERFRAHNRGYNISTKNRRPFDLVYFENYDNSEMAYSREKEIKSYKGGEAFKKLIRAGGRVVNYNRL